MIERLKVLWAKWKIQVSVVGGVLVLSAIWGTCSYTPAQVGEAEVQADANEVATEEVSNSSEAPTKIETTTEASENATATGTMENKTSTETDDNAN